MKARTLFMALCLLASWSAPAPAVVPESGMYWRSNEPGRGYFIDHQNGIVTLVAFAYEDGRPTFYVGAGTLREGFGEVLGNGYPIFSVTGYEPWHFVAMDLYRSSGGPCLTCQHNFSTPAVEAKVGSAHLYFDKHSTASMIIGLDGMGDNQLSIRRLNFGFPPVFPPAPASPLIHDLRGDWVFVDLEAPDTPALRFNFTAMQLPADFTNRFPRYPIEVVFRDTARDARFTCRVEQPSGLNPNIRQSGCELQVGDAVVLWVRLDDVAVKRLQGGRGPTPLHGQAYRGPGRIVGLRVE